MVHITGHITEQEWNWLKAKLNNEFLDSDIAKGILDKINTNSIRKADKAMQRGTV